MSSIRSGNRRRQRNQARDIARAVRDRRIDRFVDDAVKDAFAGRTTMLHTLPGMGIAKRVSTRIRTRVTTVPKDVFLLGAGSIPEGDVGEAGQVSKDRFIRIRF